ncbi:MAG: NADH-quinone oxidoreductase subunit L [Promethearchaeia archaeon]
MLLDITLLAWLCWIFPLMGATTSLLMSRVKEQTRGYAAVLFSFLGFLMALLMLPEVFSPQAIDNAIFWVILPGGISVSIGMLIDPLAIILANIVSFLAFLIMVYSVKYVEDEPGKTRLWFFMSLFIASKLLLVLADNFILLFVGWELVGVCSYALVGHCYSDKDEQLIGGSSPFLRPSRAGLKVLLFTTFGNISLLGGMILIYTYSGTLNFIQLYTTVSVWLPAMAANPGILTLASVLVLGGPIAKSAQFPLHEWLPDAMTDPAPVPALLHAATMVATGVYFIARMVPIFFYGYWVGGFPEAGTFFLITAAVGAFTAFLAGTQAMVALELKKILAFSTMSQIGYVTLGLGVAGLTPQAFTGGLTAGIFHLVSHSILEVTLFLSAGFILHVTGTIYISEMNLSRTRMKLTWLAISIVTLSLMGVPPLSGFWSKEEILTACLDGGHFIPFAFALSTVAITAFYSVRFVGMLFHGPQEESSSHGEANPIMLAPYALLAILTMAFGVIGPWFSESLHRLFEEYFVHTLGFELVAEPAAITPSLVLFESIPFLVPILSLSMLLLGAVPAYRLYISRQNNPEDVIGTEGLLKKIHSFLWNRWYINAAYLAIVDGVFAMREPLKKHVERPIDRAFHDSIPNLFSAISKKARKIQTGIFSINMLYMFILLVLGGIVILVTGVP